MLAFSYLHSINVTLFCSEVNAALLQRLRDNDSTLTNLKVAHFYQNRTRIFCAFSVSTHLIVPHAAQITKVIFKPALVEQFFSALAVHQHLERLDLDCVSLGIPMAQKFCRNVLPHMPKLKILDLKVFFAHSKSFVIFMSCFSLYF
jgi:hypothetical protein